MMVDDDAAEEEDDMLPAASLAPATTLLREQALGLLSDAQTAERKDKEILLKQVREKGIEGGGSGERTRSRRWDVCAGGREECERREGETEGGVGVEVGVH